jgi:hypothetical protein
MKKLLLFLCLVLIQQLSAQEFGGNPASVKWQQINTDSFRIIFPATLQSQAKRIAGMLEQMSAAHTQGIGKRLDKISIVLQPYTTVSNAYVGLAPYRSEFFMTPPQDAFTLGTNNWANTLALHEFRHVQQYSNFNRGGSAFMGALFGQAGRAVANALAVPDWFFEGDAVVNETILSAQGRGRTPLFMNRFRVLHDAGRKDGYQQLRNGSFRKYYPNHYELGYLLVQSGRKNYGPDIWEKITSDAAAYRSLIYPFQSSFKKHTGVAYKNFIQQSIQMLQSDWSKQSAPSVEWLSKPVKGDVVDQLYIYPAEEGVVYLQKSRSRVPAFYLNDLKGNVQRIATRSIAVDDYFSYRNGRLVFAAFHADKRWGNRDFTDIRVLRLADRQEQVIRANVKLFSPDISADGEQIVTTHVSDADSSALVLLDAKGKVLHELGFPTQIVSHPKFTSDASAVVAAARNISGEMGLIKWYPTRSRIDTILAFANRPLGFLQVQGDTLLFTATQNGRDAQYAMLLSDQQTWLMAEHPTGWYQSAYVKGKVVGSVFTADGYRLAALPALWQKKQLDQPVQALYTGAIAQFVLPTGYTKDYTITPYRKTKGLVNIHSWTPNYADPDWSFTAYGENVLSTLQTEFGYTYNENEGSSKLSFAGVYGGSYVQPVVGAAKTWDRSFRYRPDTTLYWNEIEWSAGLQLPLNFTSGRLYKRFLARSTYHQQSVQWTGIAQRLARNRTVGYMQTDLQYNVQMQKAMQQIFPHFALSMLVRYRFATGNTNANQLLLSGSLYLPGLHRNHSLVLNLAAHARDTMNQYAFVNSFPFSRGYTAVDYPRMWKYGVNYHLPLLYPDAGFANIVYLLRVRANAFFDHTIARSLRTGRTFWFRSAGAELTFDTRWFNQQPLSIGIRYSRLLDRPFVASDPVNAWEIILPMNLWR